MENERFIVSFFRFFSFCMFVKIGKWDSGDICFFDGRMEWILGFRGLVFYIFVGYYYSEEVGVEVD